MSNQPRKTFLGGFFDSLKEEYNKNKEMKESISKFREEAKKLEQSESLKEARKKYVNFPIIQIYFYSFFLPNFLLQKELGDETDKSSKIFKEKIDSITESFKEVIIKFINSLQNFIIFLIKSEIGKKAAELSGDLAKQAQKAAETVTKQTKEISQTTAFKKVSENVKAIKENIDDATQLSQIKPYRKPAKLRKRTEIDESLKNKVYESNTYVKSLFCFK